MMIKRSAFNIANKNMYLFSIGIGILLVAPLSYAADAIKPVPNTQITSKDAPLHQHDSITPTVPSNAQPSSSQNPVASVPEQREAEVEAAESATLGPTVDKLVIVNRPQITGLWAMTIPGAACIEYYNFMEDGDVAIKSGEEWTYGNYVYQLPALAEPGSPVLAMRIKYDNLKTDCSGNAVDQRGEEQQQYVRWNNPSNVDFCAGQEGQQCFASLRRILP